MKKLSWFAGSLLFLAFVASPAVGADLHGTVAAAADLSLIPGASVVLRGPNAFQRTAVTDAQGAYRFTDLDASARYSMDVVVQGFKPFARDDIRVSADAEPLHVRLELTAFLESVVVQGTGNVLSVVSNAPDVSQTVTTSELTELPSARRSVVTFSLLNPQVRQTEGVNSDGNQSNRLSIKGQSYRHTGFVLDGIINTDWVYANGPYQLVAASAVEDMRVVLNHYAAEYGPSSSGVVKVSTRSGTRDLGGEVFGFLSPGGIQARPPLAPFDVPFDRAQWGGLVYGPLVQDKTYYFLSYEGVDQERGSFIQSPEESFFTGELEETYALGRIDHHLSKVHTLTLRANFYHYRNTNANDRVGGFDQPSTGRVERSQAWGGQLTDRLVIGKDAVNYFRFNYSNYQPDNNAPVSPFSAGVRIVRPSYSTEGFSEFNWDKVQVLDFSDTFALNRGRHKFKFGSEVVLLSVRDFFETEFGEYRFNAGPPKPNENPRDYRQTFGTADLSFDDTTVQVFAQDDFDISPRLSAHVGLRYEYQEVTGDTNRLSPRLGLAWTATEDGKTRITAGAGVFSDHFPLIIYRRILRNGVQGAQVSYTIPYGVEGFPTFPESLTEPPTSVGANRRDLQELADDLRNPYSVGGSLGIQRDLGHRLALEVYGTFQTWEDQWRNNDINAPEPFIRTEPGQRRSGAQADRVRPYTEYEGLPVRRVNLTENSGSSRFYALDVALQRKYAGGVRMEARYTWSSCNTNSDINAGQPNEWNDRDDGEWGPCDNHQAHRFVGSGSVDLPYGFRFAGIVMLNSGLPVNPLTGADNNGDSYTMDRPVDGRGGFLGRNSFRAPGQTHVDMGLAKEFRFGEGLRVEARVDVFNVFNKNNFLRVDTTYGEGPEPGPDFMQPIAGIQDTEPSRRIQFGLRFLFGQR